jgi:hypothetical protein
MDIKYESSDLDVTVPTMETLQDEKKAEAIAFAQWLCDNCELPATLPVDHWYFHTKTDRLYMSTEQLYELYKQQYDLK